MRRDEESEIETIVGEIEMTQRLMDHEQGELRAAKAQVDRRIHNLHTHAKTLDLLYNKKEVLEGEEAEGHVTRCAGCDSTIPQYCNCLRGFQGGA